MPGPAFIPRICQAILSLEPNTAEARLVVYEELTKTITTEFRAAHPDASDSVLAGYCSGFQEAVRSVEAIERSREKIDQTLREVYRKNFLDKVELETRVSEADLGGSEQGSPTAASPALEKTTMGKPRSELQPDHEQHSEKKAFGAAKFVDAYLKRYGRELSLSDQKEIVDSTGAIE